MKRFIPLFMAFILFYGCDNGVVPYEITTNYSASTIDNAQVATEETTEEETSVRMLAAIDESLEYLYDPQYYRVYKADDLPDGTGSYAPIALYYDDGTIATVTDFIYYKTDRHWYIKVLENQETVKDGVTVGWEQVTRIFKQLNGVIEECDSDTVFPAYNPPATAEFQTPLGDCCWETHTDGSYFVFRTENEKNRYEYCTYPMTIVTWHRVVGDTLWVVGNSRGVDHPQLFTIDNDARMATRRTDYTKAVFKY